MPNGDSLKGLVGDGGDEADRASIKPAAPERPDNDHAGATLAQGFIKRAAMN